MKNAGKDRGAYFRAGNRNSSGYRRLGGSTLQLPITGNFAQRRLAAYPGIRWQRCVCQSGLTNHQNTFNSIPYLLLSNTELCRCRQKSLASSTTALTASQTWRPHETSAKLTGRLRQAASRNKIGEMKYPRIFLPLSSVSKIAMKAGGYYSILVMNGMFLVTRFFPG